MENILRRAQVYVRKAPIALVLKHKGRSFIFKTLVYAVLSSVGFAFLMPVLYMIVTSVMTIEDYIDPGVNWIPRRLVWDNLVLAWKGLHFVTAAKYSTIIAVLAGFGQVVSCALVGYGFARIKFWGRSLLFMLVLFTFIVPPQTIIVPLFILYKKLGWIDTYYPFIVPSFFAQGLRGSLFVLIFRQFFSRLPWELEDAARIDGCGELKTFWRIMLPLGKPALVVVFLFSLVWHWNDFYEPMMYLMKSYKFTLPLRLSILWSSLNELTGGQAGEIWNEPLIMAACFLIVLPPLILYIFTQRHFVESIERTGLVE